MRRHILFQHPELQELYYDLVAKGLASIEDAIAVGVKIELKDIEDIAMKAVYSHLDAFQGHL